MTALSSRFGVLGSLRRRQFDGVTVGRLPQLVMMAAGIVSVVSLLLLVQTSGVTSAGYDIQRLEEQRDHLRQLNYQLESEIGGLQSLDRVDREARGRLKMVPAPSVRYVTVNTPPAGSSVPAAPVSEGESWVAVEPVDSAQAFLGWLATLGESAGRPR